MNPEIPDSLKKIKEFVYDACGFTISNLSKEKESAPYDACRFQLNEKAVVFRKAKITPTKIGQFVTVWKRTAEGPIAPFTSNDTIDLVIIATESEEHSGHFVFSKEILVEQKILTTNTKEGKRGLRVYPPWDETVNAQARKTQQWQLPYFFETHSNSPVSLEKVKALYL
jgi:hypothetical protein